MRYRHPTSRKAKLGQYFTPPPLAAALAAALKPTDSILELGAGNGALLRAVLARFPNVATTAVELDRTLLPALERIGDSPRVIRADVLNSARLERHLGHAAFRSAIGNPPFGEGPASRAAPDLRREFPETDRGGWIRRDLVFLWESWRRLAVGGTLAMIVASPIICDPAFQCIRAFLAAQCSRLEISELDDDESGERPFGGVEVHTFLLVAQKASRNRPGREALLHRSTIDGRRISSMPLARTQAESTRWDYQYHRTLAELGNRARNAPTLAEMGGSVIRGSRSHTDFEQAGILHVHTNSFSDETTRIYLKRYSDHVQLNLSEPGDILVPRVGSRCLLRQAMIMRGQAPYTEAVYRIRVERRYRRRVLAVLESTFGKLWRRVHARGSCARHLTVDTLLSMPIPA